MMKMTGEGDAVVEEEEVLQEGRRKDVIETGTTKVRRNTRVTSTELQRRNTRVEIKIERETDQDQVPTRVTRSPVIEFFCRKNWSSNFSFNINSNRCENYYLFDVFFVS